MKKNILIYSIVILVIIALILIYFFFGAKNEIKNSDEISKIIADSNLEIILNTPDTPIFGNVANPVNAGGFETPRTRRRVGSEICCRKRGLAAIC